MKVDILIKTTIDIDLENYDVPEVTTAEEAVAWEVNEIGVWEFLELYPNSGLYVVDIKPAIEDKNEISLMAERMSKELPDG